MRMPAPRSVKMAALLAASALCLAPAAKASSPYVAVPLAEFTHRGDPPLHMPTGVAVAPDETVFVVDGVNHRLLQFDATGKLSAIVTRIGEEPLQAPVSARFDLSGRLWVTDTGHARVLVRAADGRLDRALTAGRGRSSHPPDLTDAVVLADGQRLVLLDNDNHRLILMNLEDGTQTLVGEEGEALRQFRYPFKLAVGGNNDLFVVDVINARVQVLTPTGKPVGSIGSYGADLGQLYRPTGVAVDREQNIWVADAVLGVIQVFTPLGAFRDVLRDERGDPVRFEMPMDLAFDQRGRLYVVELSADRARSFAVAFDPQAPRPTGAPRSRVPVGGPQGRTCTVCHLEWLEPFNVGRSTPLRDPPETTPEQPPVSRAGTCLSCHNATVVDSRRRIWQDHGHGTDIVPPANMAVPAMLPLAGGRVVCRTCHTAHAGGRPTEDIKTAVFLRVSGHAGEMCVLCHADKTRGPETGMHPTGGMPWPVPKEILDAGGRTGPNPRELTCRVCHTPHGAAHDHLLVMGTETSQLCLTCHEQMRPGMFRDGAAEHPLSPVVNAPQAAAVRELGTRLGPENRLICLSCHKLHHGKGQRFILAEELTGSRFCLRCHEDHRVVLDSPHDLRSAFPEEKNRLGMTPETGGPCSACHLFHRYARAAEPSDADPGGGKCITCHQAGRVASTKALPPLNHPGAACTACHNPHRRGVGQFLPDTPAETCRGCHEEQARLAGGRHDIHRHSAAWPEESTSTKDLCLACHRPHGAEETALYRAGLAAGTAAPDGGCLRCHGSAAPGTGTAVALAHTQDASGLKTKPDLPLAGGAGSPRVACRSCHDPHGESTSRGMIRQAASGQEACVVCHPDTAHISAIGHGPESLRSVGLTAETCRPCHMTHASPESVEPRYLWPVSLLARNAQPSDNGAVADRHCLGCHTPGGHAPPPLIATHPAAEFYNPTDPDAAGFLPLFNEAGEIDPRGRISCRTCHLSHGRATPAPVPEGVQAITARELRARRWHLRTLSVGNVCATCHGTDALRRFMYFHDPARRGGPLETGRR